MTDSTKTLVGTIAALMALVAIVAIMARCNVQVNGEQVRAAECVKNGGTWRNSADPLIGGDCIEKGPR